MQLKSIQNKVKKAVQENDIELIRNITDWLRVNGHNYNQSFQFFHEVTGMNLDEYEDLMYEVDCS